MASYSFKKNVLPLLNKIGIGLGIGALVVLLTQDFLFEIDFVKKIDYLTIDYRSQLRHERLKESGQLKDVKSLGDVVIVGIDETDSKTLPEAFPFPRSYYAHLIGNLQKAGARAIAIDITLTSLRDSASDAMLDSVLSEYDNIVLAVKAEDATGGGRYFLRSTERTYDNAFYKQIGRAHV